MKIRCPRCSQKLSISDEWAGKAIRCPGCNKTIMIPRPKQTAVGSNDSDVNLRELASLEAATEELDQQELAEVQADAAAAGGGAAGSGVLPGYRKCPHCGNSAKEKDPYNEMLCSNCWKSIPPVMQEGALSSEQQARLYEQRQYRRAEGSFYGGLGNVFSYPFGALGSLSTSIVVAIAAIFVPVALATGLARAMEFSEHGTEHFHEAKLTSLQVTMIFLFLLEVVFFLVVALQAVVDVARTTFSGAEKPPELAWSPADWGETILGSFSILIVDGLVLALVAWKAAQVPFGSMTGLVRFDWTSLLAPAVVIVAFIVAFILPMNLVGLATGSILGALNPVRIVRSIIATHAHYLFLFLLFVTFVFMFGALALVVISLFTPALRQMQVAVEAGNIVQVGIGLLFWGAVVGVEFYIAFMFGRILGLFARAFSRQLAFLD